MGRPHGGSVTKKLKKPPCPPCLSRGPEVDIHYIQIQYHDHGVKQIDSGLFLQSLLLIKRINGSSWNVTVTKTFLRSLKKDIR
jgi:hypothetical protein